MRILVIDDESVVGDVVAHCLRVDGHRVVVAGSGREGLERLQKESFDCVITDQAMPLLTGVELAHVVKESNAKMPVILMTGFLDMLDPSGAMPAGIDAMLIKPMTADELRHAVDRATANDPA